MKQLVLLVVLASAISAGAAGAAFGDGPQTSPGAVVGEPGIRAPGGDLRYVTLTSERDTVVAALRGGRVVRWNALGGGWGIPLVAWDWTTSGLSADGKTLVLATPTPNPGPVSRFPILRTRTLGVRARVTLRGSWAYDAISPDATTLFLVEYSGTGPGAAYRVRAFDLAARKLLSRPVVDRRVGEKLMRGQPVTRVMSSDGRWAYTLYARTKKEPFVHALDTVRRKAYCIDVPLDLGQQKQLRLRLRLGEDGALEVRDGDDAVAVVDTGTFEVRTR